MTVGEQAVLFLLSIGSWSKSRCQRKHCLSGCCSGILHGGCTTFLHVLTCPCLCHLSSSRAPFSFRGMPVPILSPPYSTLILFILKMLLSVTLILFSYGVQSTWLFGRGSCINPLADSKQPESREGPVHL